MQKTEDDTDSEENEDEKALWNMTKDEIGKINRDMKNFIYGYRP